MLKNTKNTYGWLSICIHWVSVFLIIALFSLGLWSEGLDYYDANYKVVPLWHKSLGVLFFMLVIFRTVWRFVSPVPQLEDSLSILEKKAATGFQIVFYLLMLIIPLSGYAVATSEGEAISVFGWFSISSILQFDNSSDIVSDIHSTLAWLLIVLAGIHALAALKHHIIDKDNTMLKMLGLKKGRDD